MIRFAGMAAPIRIRSRPIISIALCAALAGIVLPACGRAKRDAERALSAYDQGNYPQALPLLQAAYAAGGRDGTLLYQLGFCRSQVSHDEKGKSEAWAQARPALEKEIAAPGGATLERLYYLTRIAADERAYDRTTQYARQGVEQYEKGPNPNALAGVDWFRLGRLHEFLNDASGAEAAYRLAISTYGRTPQDGAIYQALALARVGDFDFDAGRLDDAVKRYDAALTLSPGSDQIDPYRHGLVLLASGRFEEAAARFASVREEQWVSEAPYGADLARKAKEVAPLKEADADGTPIKNLGEEDLRARVQASAKSLRAARAKNSLKPGDALPAEVADQQRRLVGLLREEMVRSKQIQDFCLKEGIADLVRR